MGVTLTNATGDALFPIATYEIPAGNPFNYTFTDISQDYTDLIIAVNAATNSNGGNLQYRFNGDSAANYSLTFIRYGAGFDTVQVNDQTMPQADSFTTLANSDTRRTGYLMQIANYSNPNIYKTMLVESGLGYFGGDYTAHEYRSNTPISNITFYANASGFRVGSRITIYGVRSA